MLNRILKKKKKYLPSNSVFSNSLNVTKILANTRFTSITVLVLQIIYYFLRKLKRVHLLFDCLVQQVSENRTVYKEEKG